MLFSAGSNAHGQLSNGSDDDSHVFRPCSFEGGDFPAGWRLADLAFGANHTLALLEDAESGKPELWGCGDGRKGQLGPKYAATPVLSPLRLPLESHGLASYSPRLVAAAWETSYVVLSAPERADVLVSMGSNDFGVLGVGPKPIEPLNIVELGDILLGSALDIRAIVAGQNHVVVALGMAGGADDVVVGWGASRHGQLGDAKKPFAAAPAVILRGICRSIALGHQHTIVLDSSGGLVAFGSNRKQQLDGLDRLHARSVHCTWNGTYVVTTEGHLLSTGSNIQGQLGRDTNSCIHYVAFPFDAAAHDLVQLACGSEHVLAVFRTPQSALEVWGWGWNEHGNLGSGTTEDAHMPRKLWPSDSTPTIPGPVRIWAGLGTSWIAVP
ncbi:RCC1/BLIP-II proteni [Mycena kentingensis (nom. inval.)]|nr:RCC1/BLIP-II proteni [Mycena kentingensis (nom. inval.)]